MAFLQECHEAMNEEEFVVFGEKRVINLISQVET